jgi:hypothetical protein
MNDGQQDSLDRLIANLPRDVTPPRNLWPGIVVRLVRAPRRAPPMALAAGIVVAAACLASLFTWAVLQSRSAPRLLPTEVAKSSFEEPTDAKYVLARDMMQKTFRERLALLEPATRVKIEASLAVIRQAHEDIHKALAADPESPVLEQLWESTWHEEFDLYDRVVQATQPPMTRI